MADEAPKPKTRFPIWETAAIFLAIASLWPAYVLGRPEPVWRWLSYAMLGLMLVVFVRRIAAFNRLAARRRDAEQRAADEGDSGRARLPWEPPQEPGSSDQERR